MGDYADYHILNKIPCYDCAGTGVKILVEQTSERMHKEVDCYYCEGKGHTFEPVELTKTIINELPE